MPRFNAALSIVSLAPPAAPPDPSAPFEGVAVHPIACPAIPVVARGGGHSYVAYSLGGQDGSLVIDLQHFDQVVVNNVTGTAVIGAGNRLGNVALGLYEQGQRALPHGTCPQVRYTRIMLTCHEVYSVS